MDHVQYLHDHFHSAMAYGSLNLFHAGFRELYLLMASFDGPTPGQIVRAYELMWEVDSWQIKPPFCYGKFTP